MLFYFLFLFPLVAFGYPPLTPECIEEIENSNGCVKNRTLFSKLDSTFHPYPSEHISLLADINNALGCLPLKSNCSSTKVYRESLTIISINLQWLMEKIRECFTSEIKDEIWEKCKQGQDEQKGQETQDSFGCKCIGEAQKSIKLNNILEKMAYETMKEMGLPILY
ncbi:hypothetical protein CRE_21631 [Caenorhabditis remanei]|uniref:DUF19 domain-containing protein n=1 Tax=Caenorhabditis remanei TaxID=31234 RepID=E3NP72_CAERE|nr:hypothetical protein CRE_21631 [Caenorhabditis remanei]